MAFMVAAFLMGLHSMKNSDTDIYDAVLDFFSDQLNIEPWPVCNPERGKKNYWPDDEQLNSTEHDF